ncbi:MAG: ATP-binding protein, partial [Flavobacteriaceae bacterium]|nr:ATP-binding protein [Flavobacteriaceae bacterium]
YPELILPINEIRKQEQKKVNRLVHNLTSINAHNIQEIYDLIPQDILVQNWKKQLKYIEDNLKENPKKAALMFIRIAKHNTHMKSEFSIYKKIERDDSVKLDNKEHNLRNVLLNTLHTFFSDFKENNVFVDVKEFVYKLEFDYETIQVALYHLLENTTKYTLPNSSVEISAYDNNTFVYLKFQMTSIYIEPGERKSVLKEGVSSNLAIKLGKQGDGIGMWRIKQMMELNEGEFRCEFGEQKTNRVGIKFADNVFTLRFRK